MWPEAPSWCSAGQSRNRGAGRRDHQPGGLGGESARSRAGWMQDQAVAARELPASLGDLALVGGTDAVLDEPPVRHELQALAATGAREREVRRPEDHLRAGVLFLRVHPVAGEYFA